jgi:hypothetical protein
MGIVYAGGKAWALSKVAGAFTKAIPPGDEKSTVLCWDAFRYAKEQGQDSAWMHIGAFAPMFVTLGADVGEPWERIQAVEGLFEG